MKYAERQKKSPVFKIVYFKDIIEEPLSMCCKDGLKTTTTTATTTTQGVQLSISICFMTLGEWH